MTPVHCSFAKQGCGATSSSRPRDKGDLWAGEVRLAGPHFWFAVGGCSEKSELKEPKRSRLLAHRQHGSGSIRMFDRTLLEAIEEGIVPRPGLWTPHGAPGTGSGRARGDMEMALEPRRLQKRRSYGGP